MTLLNPDRGEGDDEEARIRSCAHREKDASCGELNNRQLTLSYGSSGTQTVNDTVQNWRNVSPCGN
jgi:hypothetical protein